MTIDQLVTHLRAAQLSGLGSAPVMVGARDALLQPLAVIEQVYNSCPRCDEIVFVFRSQEQC